MTWLWDKDLPLLQVWNLEKELSCVKGCTRISPNFIKIWGCSVWVGHVMCSAVRDTYHGSKLRQVHTLQLMCIGSFATCTWLLHRSGHMNWIASPNTADKQTTHHYLISLYISLNLYWMKLWLFWLLNSLLVPTIYFKTVLWSTT